MKYTEIDGKRYEIKSCEECPFRDMGDDGYGAHCTHPIVYDPWEGLPIKDNGSIPERCPLREVQELKETLKPCPFCGGPNPSITYLDDQGNTLVRWMMEAANNESESEGCEGYASWGEFVDANAQTFIINCDGCHGCVRSHLSMEDALVKWNRRVRVPCEECPLRKV